MVGVSWVWGRGSLGAVRAELRVSVNINQGSPHEMEACRRHIDMERAWCARWH